LAKITVIQFFAKVISILIIITLTKHNNKPPDSSFDGLGVACCREIVKFAGSNPAEAVRNFQGEKILSTPSSFLRGSHVADLLHVKDPLIDMEVAISGKITGQFSPA